MKFLVIQGSKHVSVVADVRQSSYPIKGENSRSDLQRRVGKILREKFKLQIILEDWTVPTTRMSLDFLVLPNRIAVEVQGEQHFEHIPFFHKTKIDFAGQINRDNAKKVFCELNGITFVTVTKEDFKEVLENDI